MTTTSLPVAAPVSSPISWPLPDAETVDKMRVFYTHAWTRYPIRLLRYWFVRQLIEDKARRLGRPVSVLEVGIDRGQMPVFMNGPVAPDGRMGLSPLVARWDGVDVRPSPEAFERAVYTDFIQADVDDGRLPTLTRRYDVVIFLHLLEHLRDPDATIAAFTGVLKPGGIIIGGSPTMPEWIARPFYERKLRANAKQYGHASVITPERVERLADRLDVDIAFLSGAFFRRDSGRAIEEKAWWMRANVAFGYLFPAFGAELYFALEKR